MLSLAFSNRYEVLLEALLARLDDGRPGPFEQRDIIVPSAALRRSVELAVAQRQGVAANLRFAYLASWMWAQIDKLVPVGAQSPFAPAWLSWRIHALLGEPWTAEHPRLASYLAAADALMRFELAERIARLFDNYLTYRPDWLATWSAGRSLDGRLAGFSDTDRADEGWQAALWRRIAADCGRGGLRGEHPATLFFDTIAQATPEQLAGVLPPSVQVFCLPALPPLYLDMLRRLAQWTEVRVYALNPCREYWFEIVPPRSLTWLRGQQRDLYHESGNRLLAAWGRQTQAHIDLLFDGGEGAASVPQVEDSLFVSAAEHGARSAPSLLASLQDAVLELVDPAPASLTVGDDDRSLEVHVCHSLLRELEVLHDRLLDLCERHPDLRADDIVVLTPDLDTAAPFIESVFGSAPPARRLPWRITGQRQTRINPVARALDAALSLLAGRFPASRLFDLLQQAPVAERFGLDGDALARIHGWLRDAGVHWGLDDAQRARLGLPAENRHSLGEGLHRLFLAYASGDGGALGGEMFAGRVASGNPEGSDALVLGRLWRYADTLRRLQRACAVPRDPDGWRALLLAVLEALVPPSLRWSDDLRAVQAAVGALHANMCGGGLGGQRGAGTEAGAGGGTDGPDSNAAPLPLELVHAALAALLDDPARGGVPGGAVSFSAIGSLRGLAYRVVCVIGLDDGVFPGTERPAEFDLMARHPLRGDRQRRHDERNLFLDLLLSARDCLHLSYAGRSVRDNSEKPPSVLIDELLDYAARATATRPHDPQALAAARARLTVEHPLQAFSRVYFDTSAAKDARLNSFHREYCDALRQRLARVASLPAPAVPGKGDADPDPNLKIDPDGDGDGEADAALADADLGGAPFFATPLPPLSPGDVDLAELTRFLRHPARFLLVERLGLSLPEQDDILEDDESFLPGWSARQRLAQRLLPLWLAGDGSGQHDAEVRALALAGGDFPAGVLGEHLLAHELDALSRYAARLRPALAEAPLPGRGERLVLALRDETWTLQLGLGDMRPSGLVRYRYDDARASDVLSAWLAHLALCVVAPDGVPRHTWWHARDAVYHWRPVADAPALLADLMTLYRDGMARPLPFFPKSAWAWASQRRSRARAENKWHGGQRPAFGERNDAAIRLAFRGRPDPLDEQFYALAERVFDPLWAHLDTGEADQ